MDLQDLEEIQLIASRDPTADHVKLPRKFFEFLLEDALTLQYYKSQDILNDFRTRR